VGQDTLVTHPLCSTSFIRIRREKKYYVATYAMQCRVIILDTRRTTYTFHDIEKRNETKRKKSKNKDRRHNSKEKKKQEKI